jgi:hypothetical protein
MNGKLRRNGICNTSEKYMRTEYLVLETIDEDVNNFLLGSGGKAGGWIRWAMGPSSDIECV